MTGSTEGGASDIRSVDDSAVVPSPKAHKPPLQPDRTPADTVRVRLDVRRDGVSVDGTAEVGRGVHDAVSYTVVSGTALATVIVAVLLCLLEHANGWVTVGIAGVAGGVVLTLGLIRTSSGRRNG